MIPLLQYKSNFEVFSTLSAEKFADVFFAIMKPELENAYMKKRWRHNKVYRYAGTFFRFAWNGFHRFNGVSNGEFSIDKDNGLITVHSSICFKEIFIYCLIFSLAPIMDYNEQASYRILTAILIWLVYVANYFVSAFRINLYLQEMVRKTFIVGDSTYKKHLL